jgi:hypothetical protein
VRGGDLARQGHHQRQRVLGGGEGGGLCSIEHQDALGSGGVEVDVVHADAGPRDRLQFPGLVEHLGGGLHAGADDHGVVVADRRGKFVFLQADLRVELHPGLLQEFKTFFGELVGDEDAHFREVLRGLIGVNRGKRQIVGRGAGSSKTRPNRATERATRSAPQSPLE